MTKKKKKTPKTGRKLSGAQLRREVLNFFKRHSRKRFNPKQIARKLELDNNRDSLQNAVDKLVEKKQLIDTGDYRYTLNRNVPSNSSDRNKNHIGGRDGKYVEGIVDMTRSGDAYIVSEDKKDDVHVAGKHLNAALNGDKVRIRTWKPRGRRKLEGEVVKILERSRTSFIGTLQRYPKYAHVAVNTNPPFDVAVPLDQTMDAQDEDRVVIRVDEWPKDDKHNPKGAVTAVLGKTGTHDIEMKTILINNGFDLAFPEPVMRESEALPDRISDAEIKRRKDIRDVCTFTIDPDDAKDFDDALSLRYLDNGELEIGIHIADVTHFIRENTPLDKEAFNRSTSVYLVDRVLPMLPERISNNLCSLRPHEDRLAFSAIFVLSKNLKIMHRWFGRTVIHSDRRFTYNEAQEVLDTGKGDYAKELLQLNKVAKHLRKQRFKNGAINFETDEVKFRLDEDGSPIEVYVKERKDTHMLVEDFMLLANREVATFIAMKGRDNEIPFVYRVHDEPDPDKVIELARFAKQMGFRMEVGDVKSIAKAYNSLAEAALEDPQLRLLSPLAIRTMAKAEYTSNNIGHYGLGFQYYTHFTSPIRRYSDVLVHRLLQRNLGKETHRTNKEALEGQCKHVSQQERRAISAERESVKYKQVEYIEKHLGEVFTGHISGMIDRGFFVELNDSRVEGMVPFETLTEPFELADSRLSFHGTYSKEEYRMGQEIQVRIASTDLAKRQVEMEWLREEAVVLAAQKNRPKAKLKKESRRRGGQQRRKSRGKQRRK